jgi:hypothetical protein
MISLEDIIDKEFINDRWEKNAVCNVLIANRLIVELNKMLVGEFYFNNCIIKAIKNLEFTLKSYENAGYWMTKLYKNNKMKVYYLSYLCALKCTEIYLRDAINHIVPVFEDEIFYYTVPQNVINKFSKYFLGE